MTTDNIQSTEDTLVTSDGARLYWRRDCPSEAKARLIIVHGYAEHCRRYQFVVDYFAPRGFDCWRLDLRGHGRSSGHRGYVDRFSDYLQDLNAMMRKVHEDDSKTPSFLIAHSMGGLTAARWVEEQGSELGGWPLKGLVLSSPFFALKLAVPAIKRGAAKLLSGLVPRFSLPNELKASDLTRDKEVQKVWEADQEMIKKVPSRWFTEALKAQDEVFAKVGQVALPVTIHHGADDPVADPQASERWYQALSVDDKSHRAWPSLRHEIFNEIEREEVFGAIEGWLNEKLASA